MSSEDPQFEKEPEKNNENEEGLRKISSSAKGPGLRLKEARLARNLKRYDIAKRMCLSVKWIKNIEHDHYSRSTALIYIKGHLRTYARLLELPVEEILAAFDSLGIEEEFERIKEENLMNHFIPRAISTLSYSKPPSSRRLMRWVTAFTVIAAVLWLGIWWKGRHGVPPIQAVVSQPGQSGSAQPVSLPISTTTQPESQAAQPTPAPATAAPETGASVSGAPVQAPESNPAPLTPQAPANAPPTGLSNDQSIPDANAQSLPQESDSDSEVDHEE
jgi:cytoskeleton protein RodZ